MPFSDRENRHARYIQALFKDLEDALPAVWGRPIYTVFLGGGTPSLFTPLEIDTLLAGIRARVPLVASTEITLEANPGTFEKDRFAAYRAAGVTRLSIGVQSFDDRYLQAIGRVHNGEQARQAVQEAAQHFETWNIDLMYALPGQSLSDWQADLQTALAFQPPHLSIYHLTIEPHTVFAKYPPSTLPDSDLASDMLDKALEYTAAAGVTRYEVSAYSRAGHRCQHNLNYWRFGDYLGIGAGAHSKLSFPDHTEGICRQVRYRDPVQYMSHAAQGQAVAQSTKVNSVDRPFEFMLGALRLVDGLPLSVFIERTGLGLHTVWQTLEEAQRRGWIQITKQHEQEWLMSTALGLDWLNDVQSLFLP
jgi:putative oxygen-independent coproporphyrinogen III oxidase